jgi:pimeloyl-ACP methyl ester carboxylesterase
LFATAVPGDKKNIAHAIAKIIKDFLPFVNHYSTTKEKTDDFPLPIVIIRMLWFLCFLVRKGVIMSKTLILLCFMTLVLPFVMAQGLDETRGFSMVRCDDGDDGFLGDPSQIKLEQLQAAFNSSLDTVVMVHGFNNSYSAAKDLFSTFVNELQPQLGQRNYVGFYWPSDTMPDFSQAVDNANKAGTYLAHALCQISKWYGGSSRNVHLISHSLGGRVSLRAMQDNGARYVKWGYYLSMAAAVHKDAYVNSFNGTNLLPQKSMVYFSKNDWVLKYFYSLYYWLFDRAMPDTPSYRHWQTLSLEGKLEYMRKLEEIYKGRTAPSDEFDRQLLTGIERASVDAKGYVGASLGNPVTVIKVENVEMSDYVDGHSYWQSSEMLKRIAQLLK